MPKHTWSTAVKTDNGAGPVDSLDLFGSTEQNIGGNTLGAKGLSIGIQDVELVPMVVPVANIVSFFIKSDTDVQIRTNSQTVPSQTFNLTANLSFAWNNANIPQPTANPLTVDVTALYIFNKGTVKGVTPLTGLKVALVIGGFLLEQESQYS